MKNKKRIDPINFVSKMIYRFKNLSFAKHILMFYLIITFVGTGLLTASFAHNAGVNVGFSDALFTAASAFSDTGLVSLPTAVTWSIFGQAIISILILIGGLGWFALKVYFINILFGRPISFATRGAIAAERGSDKAGFSKNIIKNSVTTLLIIVVVASIALSVIFFYTAPSENPFNVDTTSSLAGVHGTPTNKVVNDFVGKSMVYENPQGHYLTSLRFGIFHAISALNNAGFDIVGSNSISPYYHQYGIQVIFMILFIIGGMGFPVIYDFWCWIKAKIRREKYTWSLFSKLSVSVYAIVSLLGLAFTFAIETTAKDYLVDSQHKIYSFWNNPMYGSKSDKSFALLFNSFSTRNAGFSTIRSGDLAPTTILLFTVLMFIGSAPSSTAGGIRTTTLGIALIGLWGKIRGREEVRAFNRRVSNQTVIQSYVVITVSIVLVIVATMVAFTSFAHAGGKVNSSQDTMFMSLEKNPLPGTDSYIAVPYTFNELIFETASAFGTTGLSAGLTSNLSVAAKLAMILLMFIGQLGVSSTIFIWRSRRAKSSSYNFVEEDVTIG